MDVETIYKVKLKGKYKFMFDLKEKQKCLITNIMERKKSIGIFATGYGKSVCFQNGAFDSRCNLRWKAYWFGNFTTEEPYD
jgi:hypothetical protein